MTKMGSLLLLFLISAACLFVIAQQDHAVVEAYHVVVVGGGVGGLAIACRLKAAASTKSKVEVTLLEKNTEVGGRCGSFDVTVPQVAGTFRHERGPSLLLLPDVYQQVFRDTAGRTKNNTNAETYGLTMKQCVPAYKVFFDDGDSLELGFPRSSSQNTAGVDALQVESRRKMNGFEPNGASKWDDYLRACEAFLDCGLPNFIEERLDLASFPAFIQESLRDFGKQWPLKPHSDVLDAIFQSNKMKALASFQDLYVGLEPYRNKRLAGGGVLQSTAPAVFGLLAAIELHPTNPKCGVFAPIGGFRAVSQSFEKLAIDLGVTVQCNTAVTSVTEDGVYYKDSNSRSDRPVWKAADLVIVNADLPYATNSLIDQPINQPEKYDWDDKHRFSCGVIAFHWSLSRALEDLNTHNVFMTASSRSSAEKSWATTRDSDGSSSSFTSVGDPFNFYVHRASKTDPTAAPKDMDSIMVLVPSKTLNRDESYAFLPREEALRRYSDQFDDAFVDQARDAVLHRLAAVESLQDVRSLILHEVVDTPASYAEKYNVAAGTPFALSHGFAQLSLTRPSPTSCDLSNVLYCGASTRPGNGVPLVLIGAKLVAEKALSKMGRALQ